MATIIVACDENNLIGNGNKLPWNVPGDLQFFKEITTNHVIIMGKNTWVSLPRKPLPKRINCIISRNVTYDSISLHDLDVEWYTSLEEALNFTSRYHNEKKQFIIGGEQIYKLALNLDRVDEILMTRIKGKFSGDRYFPQLNKKMWGEPETIKNDKDFSVVRIKKAII